MTFSKARFFTNLSLVLLLLISGIVVFNLRSDLYRRMGDIDSDLRFKISATRENMDSLSVAFSDFSDQFLSDITKFSENYRKAIARIDDLEKQLRTFGATQEPEEGKVKPEERTIDAGPNIELPQELRKKVDELGGTLSLTNYEFKDFLNNLIAKEILPFKDQSELSEDQKERIQAFFDLYIEKTKVVMLGQRIYVNKLTEEYEAAGKYLEVPLNTPADELKDKVAAWDDTKGNASFIRIYKDLNIQRIYHFPMEVHSPFIDNQAVIEVARDQMVKDMVEYATKVKKANDDSAKPQK